MNPILTFIRNFIIYLTLAIPSTLNHISKNSHLISNAIDLSFPINFNLLYMLIIFLSLITIRTFLLSSSQQFSHVQDHVYKKKTLYLPFNNKVATKFITAFLIVTSSYYILPYYVILA